MTTFNFTSGDPNNLVAVGSASMGDIQGPFVDLRTFLNGRSLNEDNLPVSMLQKLGLSDSSGQKGRGASPIATTGTRTNVAYGALSDGPDQVTGVVVPANAIVKVGYMATWQSTVANGAAAAIFIGANQLKTHSGASASPVVQETFSPSVINVDFPLSSFSGGLATGNIATSGYTGDVTTGQVLGTSLPTNITPSGVTGLGSGRCEIGKLAPGTYTISIQFKAASGTVTAKNRLLLVEVEAFS